MLVDKEEANRKFGTAIGRFHETTLLILIRATQYSLTTAQLLDFLRGDVGLALSVLGQIIACASYEDDAIACAICMLMGFCRPDTYVELGEPGFGALDMEGSVQAFSARLEQFAAELTKSKLLLTAVPSLATRLFGAPGSKAAAQKADVPLSHSQTECLRFFLRLVCDLSLLSHEGADVCRADLAAASAAGSTLLLPLLLRIVREEPPPADRENPPPPPFLLPLALRTTLLVTFRAPPAVASAIRASGILCALIPYCLVGGRSGRTLGALLLLFMCNVDALAPLGRDGLRCSEAEVHATEELLMNLQGLLEELPLPQITDLLHSVEGNSKELARLPVARDSNTANDLGEMLQQLLVSAQPAEADALISQLAELEAKAAHLESVQDDLANLANGVTAALPTMDGAYEQLALLKEQLEEEEALAQELADMFAMDLKTAVEPEDDGEAEAAAADVASAALESAMAAVAQETAAEEEAKEEMRPSTRFRLLGELPALNAHKQVNNKAELGAAQKLPKPKRVKPRKTPTKAAAAGGGGGDGPVMEENVPSQFLCAINGHIMRRPLRSPHGKVYEAETIHKWLDEHGQVCPITGVALTAEDLVVDEELKRQIQDYTIREALEKQAKLDEESDMYAF